MKSLIRSVVLLSLLASLFGLGCGSNQDRVIIYVAHDEEYSRPILLAFAKESGIEVQAVYDTEAAKTTGLVTRLIAEKSRPRADVFWNNEVVQTVKLQRSGVLDSYHSPMAAAYPQTFRDPDGYWTGFAARARVIVYNRDVVTEPPRTIEALLDPKWKGRACIANPLFGTTATHAAALFASWGTDKARAFFMGLKKNKIAVLSGNAAVRDMVARGEYAWGLTDTDDAHSGSLNGLPIEWHFPDQDFLGTLVLPNTVSLIAGASNAENGKRLIDYLLQPRVEETLARSRSLQIPLNPDAATPEEVPELQEIVSMSLEWSHVADCFDVTAVWLRDAFLE